MMLRIFLLLFGLSSTSCVADVFSCTDNAQCDAVAGARCEATGFCSTPDETCTSGFRYEPHAAGRLAGNCVDATYDLAGTQDATASDLSAFVGDMCVGSMFDPNNCGGCAIVCASGEYCNNGACGCPLGIPDRCAGDAASYCTNVHTDVENCGACGQTCPAGQLCQSGSCVETCAASYTSCSSYCALTQTDPNHCGGCSTNCSSNNIIAACAGGVCDGACLPGFADCNANLQSDGCETSTTTIAHCGGCNPCVLDLNSTMVECDSRQCVQTCNPGFVTCGAQCCADNMLVFLAGGLGGAGNVDGAGSTARFSSPTDVAVGSDGAIYVADSNNETIRKISSTGIVSTFAGTAGVFGTTDGTGSAATFYAPKAIAVDASGNVFASSANNGSLSNSVIREITPSGVVATFVGTVYGSADGTGTDAQLSDVNGIAIDATGNLYIADDAAAMIRKATPSGVVTTIAGQAYSHSVTDGTGSAARFVRPNSIAIDSAANLYVSDIAATVRKVTPAGIVTTYAGVANTPGTSDGTGTAALFDSPVGITLDASGNVYVADDFAIRKITTAGVVSTFAGASGSTGTIDGTATAARFSIAYYANMPNGLAIDGTGNIYVADMRNNTIRKISPSSIVSTAAGLSATNGSADGVGSAARFSPMGQVEGGPTGLAVDASNNVYVADYGNNTIRKITPTGAVTTIAGSAGQTGTTDGMGSVALFYNPVGVALDGAGNLYVLDKYNFTVRKIDATGLVSTYAGAPGVSGTADGTGTAANFGGFDSLELGPNGLAADSSGNLYVADTDNSMIRRIAPGGVVTTLAGDPAFFDGSSDGTGTAATFYKPNAVTVDPTGNVYVVDANIRYGGTNNTIRKITPGGVVTTIAGTVGQIGSADGTGTAALFNSPIAITADDSGNIFVADYYNDTIRKVNASGVVTTVLGVAGAAGAVVGSITGPTRATLNLPNGIAYRNGTLVIATESAIFVAAKSGGW